VLINNASPYIQRFKRVLSYIDEHIGEAINLSDLAQVANFSKFHFQRQFSTFFGISPSQYITQLRLDRSAYQLAFRQHPICDIAFDSHFQSQEAFSRAFKRHLEHSPLKFRRCTPWESWHYRSPALQLRNKIMNIDFSQHQVELTNFPTTPVALLAHHGNPSLVMRTVSQFIAWRNAQGDLSPKTSDTFNIMYHDPAMVSASEYRFDVGCSTAKIVEANDVGVINDVIEACRCAMLTFTGSNDDLSSAIEHIYGQWLPGSDEECADRPLFVKRLTMYPDVPVHQQTFEIFLPLK